MTSMLDCPVALREYVGLYQYQFRIQVGCIVLLLVCNFIMGITLILIIKDYIYVHIHTYSTLFI